MSDTVLSALLHHIKQPSEQPYDMFTAMIPITIGKHIQRDWATLQDHIANKRQR